MERSSALIDKLHQQKEQGATTTQLLATVQLLLAELVRSNQNKQVLGTAKVAVTMPVNFNITQTDAQPVVQQKQVEPEQNVTVDEIPVQEITTSLAAMANVEVKTEEQKYGQQPYSLRKPVVEEKAAPKTETQSPSPQRSFFPAWEDADEAPTLVQHQAKEIHELISDVQESLNDRLKEENTELANKLKDSPIKDLRKGIGINDRFSFVNELFRGDEAMYERSIKTINAFNIYSEAEYWMSRELKLKLGWDEGKETVKHFYQIVRRRFS